MSTFYKYMCSYIQIFPEMGSYDSRGRKLHHNRHYTLALVIIQNLEAHPHALASHIIQAEDKQSGGEDGSL